MYYQKIGLAYGSASGRDISPDYPSAAIDIQTNINEFRIVGSTGEEVGISSIKRSETELFLLQLLQLPLILLSLVSM